MYTCLTNALITLPPTLPFIQVLHFYICLSLTFKQLTLTLSPSFSCAPCTQSLAVSNLTFSFYFLFHRHSLPHTLSLFLKYFHPVLCLSIVSTFFFFCFVFAIPALFLLEFLFIVSGTFSYDDQPSYQHPPYQKGLIWRFKT